MEGITDTILNEFTLNLSQMIHEFDLVFDYIDKKVIKKLYTYISKIRNDKIFQKEQMKTYIETMEAHKDILAKIVVPNTKTKNQEFDFMNDIVLFDNILELKLFATENKNTKKTIVQYLYNMYMSCLFIGLENMSPDNEMTAFLETIQSRLPKQNQKQKRNINAQNNSNELFDSLLTNPDIMNIAQDISKDLQNQQIDPMTIMSSLLTGKPNKKLDSIVSKITNTLEQKISTGEISKEALEEQASRIINVVENSEMTNQVPMLKTLISQTKSQK
jgi:hypothetical protein